MRAQRGPKAGAAPRATPSDALPRENATPAGRGRIRPFRPTRLRLAGHPQRIPQPVPVETGAAVGEENQRDGLSSRRSASLPSADINRFLRACLRCEDDGWKTTSFPDEPRGVASPR